MFSSALSYVDSRMYYNSLILDSYQWGGFVLIPSYMRAQTRRSVSPYLFLFCMNIFSRMTSLATDIRQFQGIWTNARAPAISHLFFADDSMFFFKASTNSCQAVSMVINRFCATSGQVLNLNKSFVKFSPNVLAGQQQEFKMLLRMDSQPSLGPYLGNPIDIQGPKTSHFTQLIDKVPSSINRWNHINISQPAKLIIINSVLIGTIMHQLSVFRITSSVTNKIDSLLAMFFWKDN